MRSEIQIDEHISLSQILESDIDDLLEQIDDPDIYENTLAIPMPYTRKDGEEWVHIVEKERKERGMLINYAIRWDSKLIGGIGLFGLHLHPFNNATDEVGYWLGKTHRRKGVMTKCLNTIIEEAFTTLPIARLQAMIFDYNTNSQQLVEKVGFKFEGRLKNYYRKNGKVFDALSYAITK